MLHRAGVSIVLLGLAAATLGVPHAVLADSARADLAPAVPPPVIELAQAAQPSSEASTLDRAKASAVSAAEVVSKTFRENLQGQSLFIGVTQTQPSLELQYHSSSSAGVGTVERYSGDPSTNYVVALESPAKDTVAPIGDSKVWSATANLRLSTSYGTFALQQTLQKGSAGRTEGGIVHGDYLGFALPISVFVVRDSDLLPFAFGVTAGLGKAFLQYEAPLHYSVAGKDYKIHVQSDGTYARDMFFGGFELRVRNIVLRWQKIQMDNGESYSRAQGKRFVTFSDNFELDVKTLGYVFTF